MSADRPLFSWPWAAAVFALTGLNFFRLLPATLGLVILLIADAGWSMGTDAAMEQGLRPTKDFAYFYGLLTLVIDRGWFTLFGRSPEAQAALFAVCNLMTATGVCMFARGVGVGRIGRVLITIATPIAIMPIGFPSPAHALEASLIALALGFQALSRPAIGLVLCVLAIFVKPALGFLLALILVSMILFAPTDRARSWAARVRELLPAVITTILLAGALSYVFGKDALYETLLPLSASKLYAVEHYGFFFGTGRRFWLPEPFDPIHYVLTPAGFWLATSMLLLIGGIALRRQIRDSKATSVLTCLVLHLVFVFFMFGNEYSWLYYPFLPVCGAAAVIARWEAAPDGATGWRKWIAAGLCIAALLGQTMLVVAAVKAWNMAVRSDATAGLWAIPEDEADWRAIRDLARTSRVLLLVRSGGPTVIFPEIESPQGWYMLRPIALPAEVERVRQQIRAADYLVIPTAPDASLTTWPEFLEEFRSFREEKRHDSFLVVKRVVPPKP